MIKYFCILLALLSSTCQAQSNMVAVGVDWLKSNLPETTKVEFNKARIKFNGCRHREYELSFVQPWNKYFSLEGGISYARGQLNWGINDQQISQRRYSFLPRLIVSNLVSVSAGVIFQSAPEFKTSYGEAFDLPESKIFVVSTRFEGMRDNHQVEVELSSHRWDATGSGSSWFERGAADSKLSVSYSAFF